ANPGLVEELREALADASEGAERVRRIVKDLKSFAQSEGSRGAVDLIGILDLAVKMAANEIRARARLVTDYNPVGLVEGSESELGQVFLALLVNAAQAIEDGRPDENEIRIATQGLADGSAIVDISGAGSGIPPAAAAHVFEPFFPTQGGGAGTGLGLSVCHGIARRPGVQL